MSQLFQLRDLLLHDLYLAVRTTKNLLAKIEPNQWSYRPNESMRTLLEVAHHLVQVPSSDLAIMLEKSEKELHQLEADLRLETDPVQMGEVMEQGFQELKRYMNSLNEDDFMNKATKPFYADFENSQAKWLVEILTHTHHHRSQLFLYLKQIGHPISMFDLY